ELLRRRREFAAEIVEMALGATRHSAALADRLLALGRLEPEAVRDFDLNHFVRQLTDSMAPTFGDGIRVELDLAADLASAFADPRAVQLALLELVANARAAMPNGGRLLIRTAPGRDGLLVLELSDSGAGMSAAVLARAQAPLLARGGRGKLASAPGAGTTVKLYIPRA